MIPIISHSTSEMQLFLTCFTKLLTHFRFSDSIQNLVYHGASKKNPISLTCFSPCWIKLPYYKIVLQYSIYAFRRCVAWQLLDCLTSFNLQMASVSVFLNKDMLMCHRQYLCWSWFQVKAHPHKLVLYFIGTFIFQVAIDLQYLTDILK